MQSMNDIGQNHIQENCHVAIFAESGDVPVTSTGYTARPTLYLH